MLFKNSIKILFSNFGLVWKSMLYFLIIIALSITGIYLCLSPVVELLEANGYIAKFVELYTDFITSLNLAGFFESVSVHIDKIFEFVVSNISRMWFNFTLIAIIIFFAYFCFSNMVIMAYCNSLHLNMGSMAKQGFFLSYKQVFAKNFRYQLVNFLIMLPIKALTIALFIWSLRLFSYSWWVSILAVFVIILGYILIMSLRTSVFSAWVPTMIVMDYGVFKALRVSVKTSLRRFGRVFAGSIGITLFIICINFLCGLCTFMVGLIITLPATYLLLAVFGMVVAYEGQGMRYYVDVYNVITPMKKERTDRLKDMKFII